MKKPISFAFVMNWHISERGGGAEVQANYLAQELALREYEVHYITQTTNSKKANTTEQVGKITVHWLQKSGRFPWLDQNKYIKPLEHIRPNFIIQRLSSNVTYVLGSYSKKKDSKFIWVCTDNKSPFKNFHQTRFKEQVSKKEVGFIKYNLFLNNAKIMDYYRTKGIKYIDLALSQNKIQERLILSNFNLPSKRMISGHPEPKNHLSAKQRFDKQTVLWCANFGKHKRPEMFVSLARQMQHTNLKFVMVGGHSDSNYVKSILKNAPSNLTSTGQLPFDEALKYFDDATIFVNTSAPGGDGFPNTFIQSWFRGIPVISLGFDPDQIIENNALGYNVDSINEAQVKIEALTSNFNSFTILFKNTSEYAKINHSIKVMTDQFLNTIKDEITTLS